MCSYRRVILRNFHNYCFVIEGEGDLKVRITNSGNSFKQVFVRNSLIWKVDLTNEVMKWKQMYDEVKAAEVALKKKHETEVDELRHSTDAAVETLKWV